MKGGGNLKKGMLRLLHIELSSDWSTQIHFCQLPVNPPHHYQRSLCHCEWSEAISYNSLSSRGNGYATVCPAKHIG